MKNVYKFALLLLILLVYPINALKVISPYPINQSTIYINYTNSSPYDWNASGFIINWNENLTIKDYNDTGFIINWNENNTIKDYTTELDNNTIARIGNCTTNQYIQNMSLNPQCLNPFNGFSSDTSGRTISWDGNTFSIHCQYGYGPCLLDIQVGYTGPSYPFMKIDSDRLVGYIGEDNKVHYQTSSYGYAFDKFIQFPFNTGGGGYAFIATAVDGTSGMGLAKAPLTISVPPGYTYYELSMPQADASHDGYLPYGDWTSFNNKQNVTTAMASIDGLSFTSGTPFVKMNGANTFALDTHTYFDLDQSTPQTFTAGMTGSGLIKVTTGAISLGTPGTDYAPATYGTAMLKADGSGGTTSASPGTDYLAPNAVTGSFSIYGNAYIYFTDGQITGVSTAYDSSLMRNITYLSTANNTEQLVPISFYWNDEGIKQFNNISIENGLRTGYKAQDIERLYPNCLLTEKLKQWITINGTKKQITTNITVLNYDRYCVQYELKAREQNAFSIQEIEPNHYAINGDIAIFDEILTKSKTMSSLTDYTIKYINDSKYTDKTKHPEYIELYTKTGQKIGTLNIEARIVSLEGYATNEMDCIQKYTKFDDYRKCMLGVLTKK